MDLKLFSHVTSEVILWSCTVGVMVSLFSNRGGLAREPLKISEETVDRTLHSPPRRCQSLFLLGNSQEFLFFRGIDRVVLRN
jgi:hypothetical protein